MWGTRVIVSGRLLFHLLHVVQPDRKSLIYNNDLRKVIVASSQAIFLRRIASGGPPPFSRSTVELMHISHQ